MANDASEIIVAANGSVYVAEVGTTAPASESASLASGWKQLGFVTEDGVTFTDSKETEAVAAWQSFYPVRRIVTARDASVSFSLRQWNSDTVTLAFGGGTITEPTSGHYKYVPPTPSDVDERALLIDWQDDTRKYRLIIPKGMVSEAVETNLTRSGSSILPITFVATPDSGDDAYYLLTNDASFESGGGS